MRYLKTYTQQSLTNEGRSDRDLTETISYIKLMFLTNVGEIFK